MAETKTQRFTSPQRLKGLESGACTGTHHCYAIQGFQGGQVEHDISTIAVQLLRQRVPVKAQNDEVCQSLFKKIKKNKRLCMMSDSRMKPE